MMLHNLLNSALRVADKVEELMLKNVGFTLLSLFKRVERIDKIRDLLGTSFAYESSDKS